MELARPLVEAIDGLEEAFSSLRESADRGMVNIAAGGSTIQYLLPPFVEKYTREHPQVDVRLHNVTGKAGLELLREGEVDFAVGPMLDTPPDITFHPLVTYEPMLITRLDHPLAKKKQPTLKDIAKYPLILPPKNLSTHRVVESVFAEHELDHDVKLEVGGYDVIKQYVELGLGISIVMSHCLSGADHLHTASLRKYFPPRTYGVVLRKDKVLSPAAERFVATLARRHQRGLGRQASAKNGAASEQRLDDSPLEVGDEVAFALGDTIVMPFGGESGPQILDAAGILWVQLAARLERSPIGRDPLAAFALAFVGRVGGDPGEDAGRDRAGDRRAVLLGERLAKGVDRRELAAADFLHRGVDFERRGDHERAAAPALRATPFDLGDLRAILGVGELFAPGSFLFWLGFRCRSLSSSWRHQDWAV